MLTVVAVSAQTLQVVVVECEVGPLVQMLDVVHCVRRSESSFSLTPLTLVVVSFEDLSALLLPCAGLVELPFLDQPDYFFKSHTGAHLPLVYRQSLVGYGGSPPFRRNT